MYFKQSTVWRALTDSTPSLQILVSSQLHNLLRQNYWIKIEFLNWKLLQKLLKLQDVDVEEQ